MIASMRALSHRSFALLWSGQTISRLGDSLYTIALAWWVLQKTGSAAAMGAVLIWSTIPILAFLLLGGVVVDRPPRMRLIFVMSALFGMVQAIFYPAYTVPSRSWHRPRCCQAPTRCAVSACRRHRSSDRASRRA